MDSKSRILLGYTILCIAATPIAATVFSMQMIYLLGKSAIWFAGVGREKETKKWKK